MSARPNRSPLGWRRRLLFVAAIVLAEVALIEGGSRAVLRLNLGAWQSLSQMQELRENRTGVRGRAKLGLGLGNNNSNIWHREHVLHPYLGFVKNIEAREGQRAVAEGFATNEFGFVDEGSPLRPRRRGEAIVGVTGGSVAAQFRQMGTGQLEQELWRSGFFEGKESIRFITLASGGYKQPQQLMVLQYMQSVGVEFDAIINIDGFNEVALHHGSNARKGVHTSFPKGWFVASTGISDAATLPLILRITALEKLRRQLAELASNSVLRHTAIGNLLWQVQDRRIHAEIGQNQQNLHQMVLPPKQTPFVARGPSVGSEEPDQEELWSELVDLWERGSLLLDRSCRASGIRYFHFLQPNQYVAPSKPMSPTERALAINEEHPYRSGALTGYPLLREAGKRLGEAGILFHDLTPLYADVEEALYVDDCCHLNARGYELMAVEIARCMSLSKP